MAINLMVFEIFLPVGLLFALRVFYSDFFSIRIFSIAFRFDFNVFLLLLILLLLLLSFVRYNNTEIECTSYLIFPHLCRLDVRIKW